MPVNIPSRQLYIGGDWVAPVHGGSLDVVSPATEDVVAKIPSGTAEDVDAAVRAAQAAQKSWGMTSGAERSGILKAIAAAVRRDKTKLAQYDTVDCGKPVDEAEEDMESVATCFEYYAGLAEALDDKRETRVDVSPRWPMTNTRDFHKMLQIVKVLREPIGVVGLITPWNYPLLMATWKVAPALAAGCCCVLKPSTESSITSLELAAIAHDAGLPPGVLNVVSGRGSTVGDALSCHRGLAKLAFTGSGSVGKRVGEKAAAMIRPITMELGGKSAMLVFDDADVDKAVEWAMFGCFYNCGQVCSATTRLLLHKGIVDRFLPALKTRTEAIRVGDPLQPGVRMGPLVSKSQYNRVCEYIKSGKDEGARLLTGGERPPNMERGYYLQPTVFVDVKPNMRIWREEVFGPVLCVATFESEEEGLQLANDSEYGLGGAVISADPDRCRRVVEGLECGIVWVNCSQPNFCQAPWGGVKDSGYGRELGEWGLNNFLTVKQVTTYTSKDIWPWYNPQAKQ